MIPGVEMELGGTVYTVPPLTLGALEKLQKQLKAFRNNTDADSISTVIDCTHAALVRNYPELTRDQVSELIDVSQMGDVMESVMDVSGVKRKAQEAGKAAASQT